MTIRIAAPAGVCLSILVALGAWAAPPSFDSGASGMALRYLIDAQEAEHHGRYSQAIAYDNKALALMPHYGAAHYNRALAYMESGRYEEALAGLQTVASMHPDVMAVGMSFVVLALHQADGKLALQRLDAALHLPLHAYWPHDGRYFVTGHAEAFADMYSSIAQQLLHHDDRSIADMQAMLKLETDQPQYILANYCYMAAIAGLLDSAELACTESIRENGHDIGQYDSLGYVHVRMKQWDKAIADYSKALDGRPDLTVSLYGRGIARRAKGDVSGGNADIAAALRNEPDITAIMKRLGVTSS